MSTPFVFKRLFFATALLGASSLIPQTSTAIKLQHNDLELFHESESSITYELPRESQQKSANLSPENSTPQPNTNGIEVTVPETKENGDQYIHPLPIILPPSAEV